jgi:Glycosyl transferase family 2
MAVNSTLAAGATRTAAVTHVRHDDFFLDLWARHYGRMLGRENLFVILDGDDWETRADLSGVNVTVLPRQRARMPRGNIDRRMQREQMDLLARIFGELQYDYVFKGDCDEYIVPDPVQGLGLDGLVAEADAHGAVYSSGINVMHDTTGEPALDPMADVMAQRHLAILSQTYFKVNLISGKGYADGIRTNAGGHRVKGGLPVHASQSYYMIHLGFCDVPMWRERTANRLAVDQQDTFKSYIETCEELFAKAVERSEASGPMDPAMAAARQELCFTGDQRNMSAHRFLGGNFPWDGHNDYIVRLDDRFHGSVG